MRILMVLDREFPPDLRVENEIGTLIEAGYEIHLACFTQRDKRVFEKTGNLHIHRKSISPFLYKSSVAILTLPFYKNFWMEFLQIILDQQQFDVIHIHDLPLVGVGVKLKQVFGLKLIADLHENWPAFVKISKHTNTLAGKLLSPIFLWRNFEKKVLPRTDAVIVVVDEAKKRLIKQGIIPEKIRIVSNTVNFSEIEMPEKKSGHKETILFYAGGINRHRGLHNVIEAIHLAQNPNLRLWIIGDGNYKNHLLHLVAKRSLQKVVVFKGYQPFQKMMEMLHEADFAIIPHVKNEHTDSTIPHKLFQYMFAKKPVIVSNCIPIKRIVEETGSGIVYSANNTGQLADILKSLEKPDYKKMARNGQAAVLNTYNWDNDSKTLRDLYETLNNKD